MITASTDAVPFRTAPAAALALGILALVGSCDRPGPTEVVNRTLTVEVAGYGKGTVTGQLAGIDCSAGSGTCSLTLPQGTQVPLTGTPGIFIDDEGPFPDPNPTRCGYGRIAWTRQ